MILTDLGNKLHHKVQKLKGAPRMGPATANNIKNNSNSARKQHDHDHDQPIAKETYKTRIIPDINYSSSKKLTKRVVVTSNFEYPQRVTVPHRISESITELYSTSSNSTTKKDCSSQKLSLNTYVKAIPTTEMVHSKEDYDKVREAIKKVMPRDGYDDGSTGPILVRLAWHASGTYDKATGTGGSNGATMRYHMEAMDEANNGLECARQFLEPVKMQFPWITYADLWTLAGAVAVEELGGPHIDWKPGRVDYVDETNVPPNGRLPDGALGQDHLRDIFYRMGFNDQEIVALCGAHNLGRTHANRSGFDGPWVPNPTQFSNTYFKLLLEEEWHLDKSPAGLDQFYDEDKDMMMLPADMSLIKDPKFKQWVDKYAEDKKLFYDHFAKAFAKLLELGIRRDKNGVALVNEIKKVNNPEQSKL